MPYGPDYRYIFIGGLHRSGTSLCARLITKMPGVGAVTGAPVPENEGAYLQGAIPHHARCGMPMHFATDPQQHMTESHYLNRLETRIRLEADWAPWYPQNCLWRVEKSPVNLTRMRLLQQLFPMAHFVVMLRHPEAVAAATAKWVSEPSAALIDHWLSAHELVADDLTYLHAVTVIRYEDLVKNPVQVMNGLAAFFDQAPAAQFEEAIIDGNAEYQGVCKLSPSQATRALAWGYSPDGGVHTSWRATVRHPLRNIRERAERAIQGEPI